MANPRAKKLAQEYDDDILSGTEQSVAVENKETEDQAYEEIDSPRESDFSSSPEPQTVSPQNPKPEQRQGAGLEEPSLPRSWRGIDTAPKDGTQVEVATDVGGHPIVAYWRETRQMGQFRWKKSGRWTSPLNNTNIDVFPTVWRPLSKLADVVAAAKQAETLDDGPEAA